MHLELSHTVLVLIDIQEKLFSVMHDREALEKGLLKITKGAQALGIPIIALEQNPQKMGTTIASLQTLLEPDKTIAKMHFSCCGSSDFLDALQKSGKDQILLAGIEAHVCVMQTALHLLEKNYNIQIAVDATSSRNPLDKDIALQRIQHESARHNKMSAITTSEAALFDMMITATHPKFRDILQIIR